MPYTLKTQQISVKDPDSGEYIGVDVLTEQTKEGLIAELQAEGNTQVARINQAAVDVQSAVDQAETEAQQLISSTQSSLNTLETQKDTIAQTVASMAELGTDTTLTTAGMAADAKATGDEISNVKNAIDQKEDALSIVQKTSSDITITLEEDKFYIFPTMTELTVTCPLTGLYGFRFTSGTTPTVFLMSGITMPDSWIGTEAGKTYDMTILNGLALVTSWSV